jgi:hypothetical protein
MKFTNVYVDMDGVLCDFVHDFLLLHRRTDLFGKLKIPDLAESLELTVESTWAPIIAAGKEFWEWLPIYPWAQDLLDFAGTLGEVTILTRPLNGMGQASNRAVGQSTEGKLAWLWRELKIRATDVILTSKKHCLACPGSLLIDDDERYYDAFTAAGGRMLVMPQSYNSYYAEQHDRIHSIEKQYLALKDTKCISPFADMDVAEKTPSRIG